MSPTFHVIRHAHAVSNHSFLYDPETGKFSGQPLDPEDGLPSPPGTKFLPGDHIFRVGLSHKGLAQCLPAAFPPPPSPSSSTCPTSTCHATASARTPKINIDIEPSLVGGIFSSPIERCVATAILTVPFPILRACNYTITLLPQLQEAIKYQCDLMTTPSMIAEQAELTRQLYITYLRSLSSTDPTALQNLRDLEANPIKLDTTHLNWTYQAPWRWEHVPLRTVVTETKDMLLCRAASARSFFRTFAKDKTNNGKHYLIYTHGQFIKYFTQLWLLEVPNLGRVSMRFFSPNPLDDVPPMSSFRPTQDQCQNQDGNFTVIKAQPGYYERSKDEDFADAERRIRQGVEKARLREKRAFIRKMTGLEPYEDGELPGEVEKPVQEEELCVREGAEWFLSSCVVDGGKVFGRRVGEVASEVVVNQGGYRIAK